MAFTFIKVFYLPLTKRKKKLSTVPIFNVSKVLFTTIISFGFSFLEFFFEKLKQRFVFCELWTLLIHSSTVVFADFRFRSFCLCIQVRLQFVLVLFFIVHRRSVTFMPLNATTVTIESYINFRVCV